MQRQIQLYIKYAKHCIRLVLSKGWAIVLNIFTIAIVKIAPQVLMPRGIHAVSQLHEFPPGISTYGAIFCLSATHISSLAEN